MYIDMSINYKIDKTRKLHFLVCLTQKFIRYGSIFLCKTLLFPERISPEEKTLASSWPDELKLKKLDDNLLDDDDDFYDEDYEEDDDLYDDEDEDDYYDDEEYYEDEYNDEDGKVNNKSYKFANLRMDKSLTK